MRKHRAQKRQADRSGQEDARVAAIDDERAAQILLDERAQNKAKHQRRRGIIQLWEYISNRPANS